MLEVQDLIDIRGPDPGARRDQRKHFSNGLSERPGFVFADEVLSLTGFFLRPPWVLVSDRSGFRFIAFILGCPTSNNDPKHSAVRLPVSAR
jgi:hypothetical protein